MSQYNKMILTERLMKIAAHVRCEENAADIGTDHGYIPIWLMQNKAAGHVIISDINEGPLARATENIARYGVSDAPDLRLGGGLSVLEPGEADAIIIAGMGGVLITSILAERPAVVQEAKTLILQPRSHTFDLRRYLRELEGFSICCEEIASEERKFSEIITVRRNDQLGTDDHARISRTKELEEELGISQRILDEVPAMLLVEPEQNAFQANLDFIRMKCRNEQAVIDSINANGRSASADKRLEAAQERLDAFERLRELGEARH